MKGSWTRPFTKRSPLKNAAIKGLITTVLVVTQGIMLATPSQADANRDFPCYKENSKTLCYSDLLTKIDAGEVTKIEIDPTQRLAKVTLTDHKKGDPLPEVLLFEQNAELVEKVRKYNEIENISTAKIDLAVEPTADNIAVMGILANLLLFFLLIGGLLIILRRSSNAPGGPGQAMNFGKSRARFSMEAKTGVMFDDVAGIEEAKE